MALKGINVCLDSDPLTSLYISSVCWTLWDLFFHSRSLVGRGACFCWAWSTVHYTRKRKAMMMRRRFSSSGLYKLFKAVHATSSLRRACRLVQYAWAHRSLYRVSSRRRCLHSETAPGCGGSDGQDFGTAACQPLMSRDAVGQRGWGWTGWAAGLAPGELALDRRVTFCYGK